MNKIKITIAAVAFLLTAGLTIGNASANKPATNDCSFVKGGPINRDQSLCGSTSVHCCWVGNTEIFGTYPS